VTQYVPSPAHELSTGVSLPSVRRPATICGSAPNEPAVAVTTTSAFALFSLVITFCWLVEPSDW